MNKRYSRRSLHQELLNDTRNSDDEQDVDLPPSHYFHKGKQPNRRVVYGLLDGDDEDEDEDAVNTSSTPRKLNFDAFGNEDTMDSSLDSSLIEHNSPAIPSTSKSVYANAIPTQDLDNDIFSSTSTNKRPTKSRKRVFSSEPDHLTYSFRGAKCAFPNPFKHLPNSVNDKAALPESHIDFSPVPNPKPRLLFADAHHAAQLRALEREEREEREMKEREAEAEKAGVATLDDLEDYQLDATECVDTASTSAPAAHVPANSNSRKRSATNQQPPVTPRPHKMLHPSHNDLLASARKSNKRAFKNTNRALFR
ncbi:hypothetical protein E3P99_00270 [Wallemia hederae]|uniref:Uncharacterized protein n=1 Tax=Wallemia hederae TaxID=1540922 RepID=A0A4T0FW68_9BASI|nr:hypothetical protein E3P99_00270 [Wallemia hederae]